MSTPGNVAALRVGNGLDVHAFAADPDRPLILGGIRIADGPGLAGHSDADVLTHAVMDALLGASARGDLGTRFGVDDPEVAHASSLQLLADLAAELATEGWQLVNVDVTLVAQRPRLSAHRDRMRARLATALGCGTDAVSIKFTTADGLGALGRAEGVAAWCTCLLSVAHR